MLFGAKMQTQDGYIIFQKPPTVNLGGTLVTRIAKSCPLPLWEKEQENILRLVNNLTFSDGVNNRPLSLCRANASKLVN